ncbi:hypothetical protein PX699_28770, partial [Sphingobium sp. H39-3-25]|uniref:hypothetical protein n=1 Tax=Sphingobium arseniciresistens TaxID=3030834 RepID=UPI0023B8C6A4|nr:hypothetical protein [Sphingobium arseniciresistens]
CSGLPDSKPSWHLDAVSGSHPPYPLLAGSLEKRTLTIGRLDLCFAPLSGVSVEAARLKIELSGLNQIADTVPNGWRES